MWPCCRVDTPSLAASGNRRHRGLTLALQNDRLLPSHRSLVAAPGRIFDSYFSASCTHFPTLDTDFYACYAHPSQWQHRAWRRLPTRARKQHARRRAGKAAVAGRCRGRRFDSAGRAREQIDGVSAWGSDKLVQHSGSPSQAFRYPAWRLRRTLARAGSRHPLPIVSKIGRVVRPA